MREDLKRITEWTPAYDKRHPDPKQDRGIHGVTMRWLLKGPLGAIQWTVFTNWQLPHVAEETMERALNQHQDRIGLKVNFLPIPADLGYHSPKPMYEGQRKMGDDCEVLGGVCYYDGSTLNALLVFNLLREKGGEAVWERLEQEYANRFERKEGD